MDGKITKIFNAAGLGVQAEMIHDHLKQTELKLCPNNLNRRIYEYCNGILFMGTDIYVREDQKVLSWQKL